MHVHLMMAVLVMFVITIMTMINMIWYWSNSICSFTIQKVFVRKWIFKANQHTYYSKIKLKKNNAYIVFNSPVISRINFFSKRGQQVRSLTKETNTVMELFFYIACILCTWEKYDVLGIVKYPAIQWIIMLLFCE